jgi:hypothetical protein
LLSAGEDESNVLVYGQSNVMSEQNCCVQKVGVFRPSLAERRLVLVKRRFQINPVQPRNAEARGENPGFERR